MIFITFKNVGQGDSIVLEWDADGKNHIGIIDCCLVGDYNPVLDYIKLKSPKRIEFIVLSHLHYDHYSGYAELWEHCIKYDIRIGVFYHTLIAGLENLYEHVFLPKKKETALKKFVLAYDKIEQIVDTEVVTHHKVQEHVLYGDVRLAFLSPGSSVYRKIARGIAALHHKRSATVPDLNKLSTVIKIYNSNDFVLLTSDAVKAVFKLLNNKIEQEAILVQVPHHGSIANHFPDFWSNLRKTKKCPSVFSIGDEPKDRLPNKDTVAFFDKNNFTVHATNEVYGISEYFKGASSSMQKPNRGIMNTFSKPKGGYKFTGTPSSHNGDQKFCVFK